jgi:hypothetical protein
MNKVVLSAERSDAFTWPEQCPACGAEHADRKKLLEVKVRRGFKALFCRSPKTISVLICDKCSTRISRAEKVGNFGWGLAGLVFLAAMFVHRPESPEEMMGAGGLFWLGAILGLLGEIRQTRLVGIKIVRLSKNTWAFRFRNRTLARIFSERNAPPKPKG